MNEGPNRMDRRRFVQLLVAGAAVAATAPVSAVARARTSTKTNGTSASLHRPATAAIRKEIESEKRSLADALRVVRNFELPPGSPPALVFRALRRREGRR